MHDDLFSIGSNYAAKSIDWFFAEAFYIHKVVDHLDFLFDTEISIGFIAQVIRYGGNGIAFVDREFHYRRKSLISSYQCYIGTVQGGDHGNVLTLFLQYFFS